MLTKTLIAALATASFVIATTPANASTTLFGDRIYGLAAAITGNFITPEQFAPSLGMLVVEPAETRAKSAAIETAGQKQVRAE